MGSSVETISAAQSHSEGQILLMEDEGTAVENSTGLSVCSLVDREQTSQTVLPKDDKQTEKPKVIEKAEENMNILTEDWVKVQNLVSFSKKFLQLSDTDSEISCDNEMKCVSDNINALQTAIIQGDAVYAQKIIVTIIEKITIMIEIIEYRIIRIRKTTNNVHREQLYKDIESEVKFINEHITVLHNCTTTSGIMNEQLATIVTDCVNKIEKQVQHIESIYQTEVDQIEKNVLNIVLEEEWRKIQNLVTFSERSLKLSESDSRTSCENEITCVTENVNALQNAIKKGDSLQAQKIIITVIETIIIMIEIIEYRIRIIKKTKNAAEREELSKALQTELVFITEHITLLKDCTMTPNLLNQQLVHLVTESI